MFLSDVMNIKFVYKAPLFTDAETFFFSNKKCLSRKSLIRWLHIFYYFEN